MCIRDRYELMESRYVEKKDVRKKFAVSMQHYTFAVSAFIGMVKQFGMEEYLSLIHIYGTPSGHRDHERRAPSSF